MKSSNGMILKLKIVFIHYCDIYVCVYTFYFSYLNVKFNAFRKNVS